MKSGLRVHRASWITTLLLLILLASIPLTCYAGQYRVVRVPDGDTIRVRGNDTEFEVRLVGIDAPETSRQKRDPGQPYSQQAKKHLTALVLNKTVDIREYGKDRYGRTLGVVHVDGKNINLEMVRAGFAEAYKGNPPHGFDTVPYQKAEKEARQAKRGMWVQGEKYVSPGEWRRLKDNS